MTSEYTTRLEEWAKTASEEKKEDAMFWTSLCGIESAVLYLEEQGEKI